MERPAPDQPPTSGEVRIELVPATAARKPRIDVLQANGRCTCGFFAIGVTTTSPGEQW